MMAGRVAWPVVQTGLLHHHPRLDTQKREKVRQRDGPPHSPSCRNADGDDNNAARAVAEAQPPERRKVHGASSGAWAAPDRDVRCCGASPWGPTRPAARGLEGRRGRARPWGRARRRPWAGQVRASEFVCSVVFPSFRLPAVTLNAPDMCAEGSSREEGAGLGEGSRSASPSRRHKSRSGRRLCSWCALGRRGACSHRGASLGHRILPSVGRGRFSASYVERSDRRRRRDCPAV